MFKGDFTIPNPRSKLARGTSVSCRERNMRCFATALLLVLLSLGPASAHEFSLGIYASGDQAIEKLISAVRGVLIAADERDGHPEETSDGHLGGVDVHILPFHGNRRVAMPELVNGYRGQLDFLLLLETGVAPSEDLPGRTDQTIVLDPGILPAGSPWQDNEITNSFAARYHTLWSSEADIASAMGYNAAQRIDAAIRPHDGIDQAAAIIDALVRSKHGIDWQ